MAGPRRAELLRAGPARGPGIPGKRILPFYTRHKRHGMSIPLTFQSAKRANPAVAWASSLVSAPTGRFDPHCNHNFIDIGNYRRPLASAYRLPIETAAVTRSASQLAVWLLPRKRHGHHSG